MKQKIFHICIGILFIAIFGYLYGDEYWEFQGQKSSESKYQELLENIDFSFEDVGEQENISLHTTPDIALLDKLVDEIESAKDRVYVAVYIFTEKRMRDALIRAHDRGVAVKILLENNPYKAPYLNDGHYNILKEAGVNVRWSDPLNYSLNHAKLLIIDEKAYISTGNFSYSLFTKNRDFLVELGDEEILSALTKIFLQDFSHEKKGVIHPELVLSPDYSREKMTKLLTGATKRLDIYFPYIADRAFEQYIFQAAERGVEIRFLIGEEFYKENSEHMQEYKNRGIEIRFLERPHHHAKALLMDEKILYIGSINFSRYSFDENREIGVLIKNPIIISEFLRVFLQDFQG